MKYSRVAMVVILLAALIFWFLQRNPPDSLSVTSPIKSAFTTSAAKPITAQVAPPVMPAAVPSNSSALTSADLPKSFDPRALQAKDELHPQLEDLVNAANAALTPEREKGFDERWIASEEITALVYKYALNATPALNDAGDVATYAVDDAAWADIKTVVSGSKDPPNVTVRPKVVFVKVNGEWRDPYDERDPFAVPY